MNPKPRSQAAIARDRQRRERAALKLAADTWERLTAPVRRQLVEEIVKTRAAELRRAYRGVIAITFGRRTRTRRGRAQVVDEPVVVFLVRRKDRTKRRPGAPRPEGHAPERILTYCSLDKRRVLCSAPTDIECASDYRTTPQGALTVTPPGNGGSAACIVRVPGPSAGKDRFAVSCRHVFIKRGASVRTIGGVEIGRVADIGGILSPQPRKTFDAALARLRTPFGQPDDAIAEVVWRLGAAQFAKGLSEVLSHKRAVIHTPRGDCHAKIVRPWQPFESAGHVGYDPPINSPSHAVDLFECEVDSGHITQKGDSGSPVTNEEDNILLGMHISGSCTKAMMIPAYALLLAYNYGFPEGQYLELSLSY